MAARFIFKLQPVLEQRERREQEQQRRIAELDRERVRLEDELRRMQRDISAAKGELRGQLGNVGTRVIVRDVRLQAGATLQMLVQAQSAALALAGVYKRLEAGREELRLLSAARKAVQLLKDRRYQQWRGEIDRRESHATDELATNAYVRSLLAARGVDPVHDGEGSMGLDEDQWPAVFDHQGTNA